MIFNIFMKKPLTKQSILYLSKNANAIKLNYSNAEFQTFFRGDRDTRTPT